MEEPTQVLRNKLRSQDGKIYLLSAQLQKQKTISETDRTEIQTVLSELEAKSKQNEILENDLQNQKMALKSSNGKVYLLQYQLEKMKKLVAQPISPDSEYVHYLLIHKKKIERCLCDIREGNRRKQSLMDQFEASYRSNGSNVLSDSMPVSFFQKALDIPKTPLKPTVHSPSKNGMQYNSPEASFLISKFIKNDSLLSETSNVNISSYSLNTTVDHGYLKSNVRDSFLQTPQLHEGKRMQSRDFVKENLKFSESMTHFNNSPAMVKLPLKSTNNARYYTEVNANENQLDKHNDLNELVLDSEAQHNLRKLDEDVNKKSFSIFLSPNAFRENIGKIRKENEKLRADICRFRGKLEGMKSELSLIRHKTSI